MRSISAFILITIFTLLFSCIKEEKIIPHDYPYLVLNQISTVNETGVTLTAEIISLGSDSIIDFGFVWSTGEQPTIEDFRQSISRNPSIGAYEAEITNCINNGDTYFIRPYLLSSKYTVYGNALSFKGLGSMPFVVTDFSPKAGKVHSEVVITGNNLNYSAEVYFGDAKAKIVSADYQNLVVEVPYITENVNITIKQNDQTKLLNGFEIIFPWSKILIPDEVGSIYLNYGFAIGSKGYFMGVRGETFELWEYEPETNAWNRKSDYPGLGKRDLVYFAVNDRAYCGFGNYDSIISLSPLTYLPKQTSELWEYDPLSDTWIPREDFPLYGCYNMTKFSDLEKAYIGFAAGPNVTNQQIWSYEPIEDRWESIQEFPRTSYGSTAFGIGNTSFVGLGKSAEGMVYDDFYEYDPVSDNWTFAAIFPGQARYSLANFVIGNNAYLCSGHYLNTYGNSVWQREVWMYNSDNKSFTRCVDIPELITTIYARGISINEKGYIYNFNGYLWEFDPEKN